MTDMPEMGGMPSNDELVPGAAVGAILAPISGRVLDSFGPKKPILLGLSFATIGWIALTLLLRSPLLLGFVAGHVFYMIGIAYPNDGS